MNRDRDWKQGEQGEEGKRGRDPGESSFHIRQDLKWISAYAFVSRLLLKTKSLTY